MSNPMFDDFIELDLLETTETTSDMFAYYLGGAIDLDDSSADLGAAAAALTSTEDEPALAQDLVIKQEDVSDSESSMLLDPVPLTQLELSATAQQPSLVFGENTLNLVSPDQLTIAPQATISLSAATSSPLSTTASTTAATGSSDGQDAPMTELSPRASSTSKRSSPEPAPSARKHAKTESVSKSKPSISSRKSSTSSTTSTVAPSSPKAAGATQSTSSSTPSESTATSPEPTAESLTSTANTTLSPATLQFLLQQQQETPLIPQLFTGKLSREEIEATLARLLESTKHLIASSDDSAKIKEEAPMSDDESDDNMDGLEGGEASEQTHGLKTQPGIKTDDIPSSTDLKKMTSKERRQLRNKISARNFRVRRKEYIFTLEGQVLQHKTEARHLREAVTLVQEENVRLKTELEEARQQLAAITISSSAASAGSDVAVVATCEPAQAAISAAPLSKENQTLLSSILNRNVTSALSPNAKSNLTLTLARPQSPILTPNLHKDVPNSSSGSTSQNSWKDKNPIMVHTTLVPEICFGEEFQFDHKAARSKEDEMIDRPWMRLNGVACESKSTVNPFWISGVVFDLMQTFTCMTMSMLRPDAQVLFEGDADLADVADVVDVVDVAEASEVDSSAERDWELQQDLWALSQVEGEDEMTDEQMQLLYDLSQLQISTSRTEPVTSVQEDPNMLEWLYESMMARLVDMDLQSSQEPSPFSPFSDAHLA